jgi:hypothetical protein
MAEEMVIGVGHDQRDARGYRCTRAVIGRASLEGDMTAEGEKLQIRSLDRSWPRLRGVTIGCSFDSKMRLARWIINSRSLDLVTAAGSAVSDSTARFAATLTTPFPFNGNGSPQVAQYKEKFL